MRLCSGSDDPIRVGHPNPFLGRFGRRPVLGPSLAVTGVLVLRLGAGVRGAMASGFGVNEQHGRGWDPAPEQIEEYPLIWSSTLVVWTMIPSLTFMPLRGTGEYSILRRSFVG